MRILHAISEMGSGGAEAVVQELALGQREAGHDVAVLSSGGHRERLLERAGVRLVSAPLQVRSVSGTAGGLAAASAARTPRPDVVHGHNVRATAVAHLAVRRLRRAPPLVATFHGVAEQDYPSAVRWLDRCADEVVTVSDVVADRLVAAGLQRRPYVVHNAVTTPPAFDRREVREDLGLPQDVPVALCVARVAEQKRHDVLVAAWDLLDEDAVLVCVGAGPLLPQLQEAAAASARRIVVLGERTDVAQLLSAADLLVLASDWEGLPMAVLEAMSAGLPVVATDVDGLREAVGPDAGLLVPPRDPGALATALSSMLSDAPARQAAGAAAARRVEARHSVQTMLAGYERVYEGLGVQPRIS